MVQDMYKDQTVDCRGGGDGDQEAGRCGQARDVTEDDSQTLMKVGYSKKIYPLILIFFGIFS